MATLPEHGSYVSGIYQIETTDPVLGGPPTAPANIQAKQLADRTKWLKDKLDSVGLAGDCSTYSGNMDLLNANGFYYVATGASNKPESAAGMCIVMRQDISGGFPWIVKQLWIGTSVYFRNILVDTLPSVGFWVKLQDDLNLPGSVAAFARSSAPSGWLKANGAAVNRTTYANLFAIIGTTYGPGNGTTTFNLPDLRGEFIRGLDDGRGVDTGRVLGSAQGGAIQSHTHALLDFAAGAPLMTGAALDLLDHGDFVDNGIVAQIQATGGTETRPRNIALLYCIKY